MVKLENEYTRACHFDQNMNDTYCACDFRINIYRCDDKFFARTSWITLGLTLLNTILEGMFLYYLIKVKKQPFFLTATRERGMIRPRPIHSFHLLILAFNASKSLIWLLSTSLISLILNHRPYKLALAFNTICLITESYPCVIAAE